MRTWRLSLTGTVIVVLLVGLAGTVLARTDGSTKVTGTYLYSTSGSEPEFTMDGAIGEDWVGHGRGMGSRSTVEWSDPRLPAEVTSVANFEAYGNPTEGDVGAVAVASRWLLEDAEGSWSGPWMGWCDEQNHCRGLASLTGHGAYEGFYAVLTEQPQEDENGRIRPVFEGAILAGAMPPVPEPLEPTTG
jgi:hypothetical protein